MSAYNKNWCSCERSFEWTGQKSCFFLCGQCNKFPYHFFSDFNFENMGLCRLKRSFILIKSERMLFKNGFTYPGEKFYITKPKRSGSLKVRIKTLISWPSGKIGSWDPYAKSFPWLALQYGSAKKLTLNVDAVLYDNNLKKNSLFWRLQLETEIDQLRRRVDYNQDVIKNRDQEIEALERELQQVNTDKIVVSNSQTVTTNKTFALSAG